MATADRVDAAGWWPTKAASPRDHVGPARCAECHALRGRQQTTAMANTAHRAADAEVLRSHDRLTFAAGSYSYAIEKDERGSVYTVTDGRRSLSAVLGWAFGVGKVGQSYLFEREGRLHEARVSYYDALPGLDFTPRRALSAPRDVEEAMARPVDDAEARRCFGCHTTASTTASGLDVSSLIPGVTCEACHGPGREHSELMDREDPPASEASILDPGELDPVDSVDFCGACHATFWDVKLADEKGLAALRSQPYRLQSSRCWDGGDARITCVACHDPHRPLVRDSRSYDRRCLRCHVASGAEPTGTHPGRACTVAAADCAGCHMPKYEVAEMHFEFTDHLIRVVPPRGGAESLP